MGGGSGDEEHSLGICDDFYQGAVIGFQQVAIGKGCATRQEYGNLGPVLKNRPKASFLA
jgi:hypothetical protein